MNDLTAWLSKFFGHEDIQTFTTHALHAALVFIAALWLTRVLRKQIARHMIAYTADDATKIELYQRIATYIVMLPAIPICIHILGIDMTPLFATGGIFALAIGFGMKTMAENFISGAMLRFEKIAKPGDVLELDGATMTVKSVGLRSTTTDAYDGREVVIPNADLLQSRIGTYTLSDKNYRIKSQFRVNYDVEQSRVSQLMTAALTGLDWTVKDKDPVVHLADLQESVVRFEVYVWVNDPSKAGSGMDALNEVICKTLSDNGIKFAAPRLSVELPSKT